MVDRLLRRSGVRPAVGAEGLSGVGVAVELREAAGGDVHPQPVTGPKQVARGEQINVKAVHALRLQRRRTVLPGAAVAGADDARADVQHPAVGPDIEQLHREVGVGSR